MRDLAGANLAFISPELIVIGGLFAGFLIVAFLIGLIRPGTKR